MGVIFSSRFARELSYFKWARIAGFILIYILTCFLAIFSLAIIFSLSSATVIFIFLFLLGLGIILLILWTVEEYHSIFMDLYDNIGLLPYRRLDSDLKSLKKRYSFVNPKRFKKPRSFFNFKDRSILIRAIKIAELKTSCEIRLHVARTLTEEPEIYAERIFNRLRMQRTKRQNACLIAIGLIDGRIKIYADSGIRLKINFDYFYETENIIKESLEKQNIAELIANAIIKLGNKLAEHFPHEDNMNELPDNIDLR